MEWDSQSQINSDAAMQKEKVLTMTGVSGLRPMRALGISPPLLPTGVWQKESSVGRSTPSKCPASHS